MNKPQTIFRHLWLILICSLPVSLIGQATVSHVYKIYAGAETDLCKDCPKELRKAHFVLRMEESEGLVLEMVNLNWFPKTIRKKKDQISFSLQKEDKNCMEWQELESITLDRNSLRTQLYAQMDDFLWSSEQAEFNRILLNGLRKWQRAMKEEATTYDYERLATQIQSQAPVDIKGKYETYIRLAAQELERRISIVQGQTHLSEKQKNSQIGKLEDAFNSQKRSFRRQYKKYKRQRKRFKKFLKGKSSFNMASQRYVWRLVFPMKQLSQAERFDMQIIRKKQSCASILFDAWPLELKDEPLQAVDQVICVPVNRSRSFFSHPRNVRFKKKRLYRPTTKFRKRKAFTLEFEKGKSDYTLEDLEPIREFLTDSSYTILRAQIEAYASVEGDSAINIDLQQKRADILNNLLVTINEDSIETEIYTAENWKLFSRQLSRIHEADGQSRGQQMPNVPDLRGQSQAEVKTFLEDEENEALFEPLLAKQRKAVLKLIVSYRLTSDKKAAIFQEDMQQIDKLMNHPKASEKQKGLAYEKILAMRRYVRDAIRRGELEENSEKHQKIFNYRTARLDIMDFYDFKRDFKAGHSLVHQDMTEILRRAYKASIRVLNGMTAKHTDKQREQALNDAMQVQFFTYQLILRDTLDVSFFCEFRYPDAEIFWPLKMNRIDFGIEEGKSYVDKSTCPYRIITEEEERQTDSRTNFFYKLTKKLALDPKGPQLNPFYRFDLFKFLSMNINYWDEKTGKYYDREVDEMEMLKWFEKLDRVKGKMCSKAVNQLRLNLHSKLIYHYAQLHDRDARGRLQAQAWKSAEEIRNYYKDAHADKAARLAVVEYLMARQPLLYNKSVWSWSHELLEPWEEAEAYWDADAVWAYYKLEVLLSSRPAEVLAVAKERLSDSDWCRLLEEVKPVLRGEEVPLIGEYCRGCE